MTTRGIRLNNPGCIRHGDPWQGLAPEQIDPEFCAFIHPEWGIRAIARLLITYQDRHGLNTVRGIINRWAPPTGMDSNGREYQQDTLAYADHVARRTGFGIDDPIDVHQHRYAKPLVKAIIQHENGQQPYSRRVINRGLELAGIAPDHDPAIDRPEGQAGAVVAGTAGAVGIAELVNQAGPAIPFLTTLADRAPYILLGAVALGVGWFAFSRWADK